MDAEQIEKEGWGHKTNRFFRAKKSKKNEIYVQLSPNCNEKFTNFCKKRGISKAQAARFAIGQYMDTITITEKQNIKYDESLVK